MKDQEANIDKIVQGLEKGNIPQGNDPWHADINDIDNRLTQLDIPAFDQEALFDKIQRGKRISSSSSSSLKGLLVFGFIILAIIALSVFFLNKDKSIFKTESQEYFAEVLPDGSSILLNANSQIALAHDFANNRTLRLDGEAFFDVKPGTKFKIETVYGDVTVLGTSFTVSARDEALIVKVKTGRVAVAIDKEYVLEKGDRLFAKNQEVILDSINVSQLSNWESNYFYFTSTRLDEVLMSLKSWYDIEYDLKDENKASKHFTGSYIQDDLDTALEMVLTPLGLKYQLEDNVLSIE